MYNLQYDAVRLKQYASKIRQTIVSTIAANSSLKYTVKLESEPHLKYSEDDPHGLTISVNSTQDNNNKTKLAYSAILLSWGVCTKLSDATHLPYLLERGEQKIGTAVKSILQTIFDCSIKQFSFTQHQLLHFGFNFLEHDTSKDTEHFVMIYKTPQVNLKDKLTFSFDIGDVRIIWSGSKEEASKPSEVVNIAYQMIQNQIFYMVTLDITVFDLCEVLLPKAEVKSSGIVKMKTPEIINCVFTLLNEICDVHAVKEIMNSST
ncbi:uncharacterized protein LOC126374558 isoform X2 [Pectinophora gossypiella]|nr:uncharacterized protein LOC126374558 isoform X2 [Pectinophora gossypiella]